MATNLNIVMIQENANKEFLDQCINSIRNQKCKSAKAIMVGGKHTKAELLNKGLELGEKSEYILFINTHEELKEGYVDKCMSVFERYPEIGAVYTDYDKAYLSNIREYLPSFNRAKITAGWSIPTTAIFKRKLFQACGTFDNSLSILEEWDFWLRASEAAPLYHIPNSLYISKWKKEEVVSSEALEQTKKYILEKAEQRQNGS